MEFPIISVIVPIYNAELYLEESINSILSQTYPNLEIILVDDGSTDASSSICDTYAKNYSQITVIHKKKWWHFLCAKQWFRHCHRGIYNLCRCG